MYLGSLAFKMTFETFVGLFQFFWSFWCLLRPLQSKIVKFHKKYTLQEFLERFGPNWPWCTVLTHGIPIPSSLLSRDRPTCLLLSRLSATKINHIFTCSTIKMHRGFKIKICDATKNLVLPNWSSYFTNWYFWHKKVVLI